ncbi:MAG: PRC-barrel domain-containing protein [Patescibacteria group bacterium]|nr:PRC-barrel domain-containing protein [Patescibacteria group bacterium]
MQSLRYVLGDVVFSSQTNRRLGKIREVLIDPEIGKIIAFGLDTFLNKNYLAPRDIIEFGSDKVVMNKEEELCEEKDLPRIKQIREKRIRVLGASVFTESATKIGKMGDLIFDETSGEILRYYVSRPFFSSPLKAYLILEKGDIKKIEKRGVIVRDLEKREKTKALAQ